MERTWRQERFRNLPDSTEEPKYLRIYLCVTYIIGKFARIKFCGTREKVSVMAAELRQRLPPFGSLRCWSKQ